MTVALCLCIAALIGVITYLINQNNRLAARCDALTGDLVQAGKDALSSANSMARKQPDVMERLLDSLSKATDRQATTLMEAVKTAWAPAPHPVDAAPTGPLTREQVMAITRKYGLPVPEAGLPEDDNITDPTDAFMPDPQAVRMDVRMEGEDSLDSDEPFGIAGLKAGW